MLQFHTNTKYIKSQFFGTVSYSHWPSGPGVGLLNRGIGQKILKMYLIAKFFKLLKEFFYKIVNSSLAKSLLKEFFIK